MMNGLFLLTGLQQIDDRPTEPSLILVWSFPSVIFFSWYEGRCAPQHIDNHGMNGEKMAGPVVGVKVIHSFTGIDSHGMD